VQLAVGRLQLQEQRVASVVRRADGLRDALQAAQKEAAPIQERLSLNLKILEQNVRPAERSDIEAQVAAERQRLARVMADVQRLQSEEQAATAEAVAEQQRWIAINAELETLDRSLRRRQ
jgi:hypothetical protein